MSKTVTHIDAGTLDFGHLGSVLRFNNQHVELDGMVLIRISHEKRFRSGTFLGMTSVSEYERTLKGNQYFVQTRGIFLPVGAGIELELSESAVRPEEGTAGAATWEHVGKEAHLPGEGASRGMKSEIIDHFLGEGTSFVYTDGDGLLDPDSFASTDRVVLADS